MDCDLSHLRQCISQIVWSDGVRRRCNCPIKEAQ